MKYLPIAFLLLTCTVYAQKPAKLGEILRCDVIETEPLIRLACRNSEGEFVHNVSIASEYERITDSLDAESLQVGVSLVYLEKKVGQLCLHDVEAQGDLAGARHSAGNMTGECFKWPVRRRKK